MDEYEDDIDEVDDHELSPCACAKLQWIFGLTEKEVLDEYKLWFKTARWETEFDMYLAGLYNTRTCFETLDIDRY